MKRILLLLVLALAAFAAAACPVHRSYWQKVLFARAHPCPSTGLPTPSCRGHIIDHIKSIKCGGPDLAINMQWQTIAAAKAKDRIENKGCK